MDFYGLTNTHILKGIKKAGSHSGAQLAVTYNDGYRIGSDGQKDILGYPAKWLKAVGYENPRIPLCCWELQIFNK
jgi:protein-disulfide isomerase